VKNVALAALLMITVGCSGSKFPKTYPVTGVVTYNGDPVENAVVTLIPVDPAGRSASGETDAQGEFSVKTYHGPANQPLGALEGDYSIIVSKVEAQKFPDNLTPEELMEAQKKMPPPKSLLPLSYSNAKTSDLKATIERGKPTKLVLELKDK